jgi:crossover junction endodeoxyribonuclease RuvC
MLVEKIILGIDPGTSVMGFGIISVKGKKWN